MEMQLREAVLDVADAHPQEFFPSTLYVDPKSIDAQVEIVAAELGTTVSYEMMAHPQFDRFGVRTLYGGPFDSLDGDPQVFEMGPAETHRGYVHLVGSPFSLVIKGWQSNRENRLLSN